MTAVGLLLCGAVLFLNGLLFLGKTDVKAVAVFNLFVGGLQTAIPLYLIATADSPDEILGVAGVFLFGFTFLLVGIVNLKGYAGDGIGWYSLWVAVVAVGFSIVAFTRFDDPASGLLWAQWSVLWALFFVVLGLGVESLTVPAGWLTLVLSVTTATVPGFLQLLGVWGDVPLWIIAVTIVFAALVVWATAAAPRSRVLVHNSLSRF